MKKDGGRRSVPTAEMSVISTEEAAARLGVAATTVIRWFDEGHLKGLRTVGGHRRIYAESVEVLRMKMLEGAG